MFSLIGMGKRRDLEPSNNKSYRLDKLVALPAVILGEQKSLISKPGRQGSSVLVKILSRRSKISDFKTRAVPVRRKLLFMGDLDDIQFQPIFSRYC